MYKAFAKRLFDVILSGLAIAVLSPIYLVVALLVLIFMGRPIIFKQERTSKDEKRFYIYKFKTMKDLRDVNGKLLPETERKCRFGDILRSTSLDELPELWNIFTGDMSIIGPRPLLVSYLPYYKENEKERNLVRGGLIPPEVLNLTLTPTWDEQLKIESEYARKVSFMLDFKIFLSVFGILYKRVTEDYGEYVRKSLNVERAEMLEMKPELKTAEEDTVQL